MLSGEALEGERLHLFLDVIERVAECITYVGENAAYDGGFLYPSKSMSLTC